MKALFLDRDGVINKRIVDGYVVSPKEFELLEDIIPVLQHAKNMGYRLILISNQQGVGKGVMTDEDLATVTEFMHEQLRQKAGFSIDEVQYCTDMADSGSTRRKPAPGMLLEAIENNKLKVDKCWFLGDSVTDSLAGRAAGVNTILIGNYPPTMATLVMPSLLAVQQYMNQFLNKL